MKTSNVLLEKGGAAEAFTFSVWANGRLLFAGWDGSYTGTGFELWTSDGTPSPDELATERSGLTFQLRGAARSVPERR